MKQKPDQDTTDFPHVPPSANTGLEHVWEFAGQDLDSGNFTNAMIHFYRGEMSRSNSWRLRLDATTNWAVITTGAALTFVFSDPANTATILIIDSLFVLLFLFIEARRYRYYELWTYRVRVMEKNFFAGLLSPPFMPQADWADKITDSLNNPRFPIGLMEALGRRYRRNYAPIFLILAGSWIGKVYMHPTVLMCALEARQKTLLKRLVHKADPNAFVILTAVEDVRGGGFRPLET